MFAAWGVVSAYSILNLVGEREQAFREIIESYQETILTGQYRQLLEGVNRAPRRSFEIVKICWAGDFENKCETFTSRSYSRTEKIFAREIQAAVSGSSSFVVTVFARASFLPSVILSAIVFFAFLFSAIMVTLVMRRHASNISRLAVSFTDVAFNVIKGEFSEDSLPKEILPIAKALASSTEQLEHAKISQATNEAIGRLAAQVAHDIRSPLVALENAAADIKILPEDERLLIRSAISRIKDIANSLIDRHRDLNVYKKTNKPESTVLDSITENSSVELLSSLIDPIITEKRIQFRSTPGINIEGRFEASSYGLFVSVQPGEFRRVLSNLINNSVEAISDKGTVTVSLCSNGERVQIIIADNGKGISSEILSKLGQPGATYGKPNGLGLGLYHARESVKNWGGDLEIISEPGRGTSVILSFTPADRPAWFISKLELIPETFLVILDDDSSIHLVWNGRFEALNLREHGINVLHFFTPSELTEWVSSNSESAQKALYLIDYELLGHKETGLDLINKLKLESRSVLVTSRSEEKLIRDECEHLKVGLIPKWAVGFVPISVEQGFETPDLCLIDDDEIVHMTWKHAAKKSNKVILHLRKPEEFFENASKLNKNTPIYVDSFLGNGIRGEELAKDMARQGFTELWLCTGCAPYGDEDLSHLRGVVGKDVPWVI